MRPAPPGAFAMEEQQELVTARELARRWGVAPDTVREWCRQGRIPSVRLSRKVIRFSPAAALAALRASGGKGVRNG